MYICSAILCARSLSPVQLFVTAWTVGTRLLCPWGFTRQEYWNPLSCLLRIFPTHGSNTGLSQCRQLLSHLSRQGSPNVYVHTHDFVNYASVKLGGKWRGFVTWLRSPGGGDRVEVCIGVVLEVSIERTRPWECEQAPHVHVTCWFTRQNLCRVPCGDLFTITGMWAVCKSELISSSGSWNTPCPGLGQFP